MAHLLKAFILFVFGFAILANLGDALEKNGAKASSSVKGALSSPVVSEAAVDAYPRQEIKAYRPAEQPLQETKPVIRKGSYAQVCASFDPIARPEEIIDILEYASETTGTPVDVLYAVWQKETGYLHGDGRMSGGCDLKSELTRRDADAETRHWDAMIAMADVFGWKQRYGKNLERMTCSCPKYRVKGQYGGCCGPFQFSGNEVAHQYAIPRNLDPMTFCGGALIAGWELKKHHDNAFKPVWSKKLKRHVPGRGTRVLAENASYTREHAAWHAAMSRYYGGDTGGVYGRTAVTKWKQFHAWYRQDQTQPGYLVGKILGLYNTKHSLRILRSRMSFASNP